MELDERIKQLLVEALARIRFGEITLRLHDGVVTDVEVREKTRLPARK